MTKSKKEAQKSSENNSFNRRRFPRVSIKNDLENARALVGAQLEWLGEEKQSPLQIFDISYSGAAVENPKGLAIEEGQCLDVRMLLGDMDPFQVASKIIWFNDSIVGIQFQEIDHVARMRIDEFLEDKIIGSHMILVSPQYFSDHVDFNYWFHGPNNTNVFLWGPDDNTITRAMVSFDGQAMIFEGGEFHRAGGELEWDIQGSYSVETLPKENSEDLLVILEKDSPLVERSIEILTQLKEVEAPVEKLLQSILEAQA